MNLTTPIKLKSIESFRLQIRIATKQRRDWSPLISFWTPTLSPDSWETLFKAQLSSPTIDVDKQGGCLSQHLKMICLSLYALIASATILACVPVCYRQFEMHKFVSLWPCCVGPVLAEVSEQKEGNAESVQEPLLPEAISRKLRNYFVLLSCTIGEIGEIYGCMICISLLGLVSAAALIICVPYWTRGIFQSKCSCPKAPVCPDCGMPF
ncbi:unnamed protein product [Chrysodeixis includens]|uniref:Uncharacterized protein n=1 Tax=Chrysodeixis includens TaxID=689277 RepID=A0A9N8Q1X3_CHRIL|nr:unnamed protein product [Chrysodeixis includens]